ncbi:hypothetical protein OHD62_30435 [Mesorhizobium sp. YC-39]|nr:MULTISPECIES: hypothetical protein [unclassified Mesorhizobium]MCV3210989.1 hypothetical protein [Mesorhizobium sp. YC-2]MCV3232714.1 hypothetical protein [Mesorhizobium sp. YC-39]
MTARHALVTGEGRGSGLAVALAGEGHAAILGRANAGIAAFSN